MGCTMLKQDSFEIYTYCSYIPSIYLVRTYWTCAVYPGISLCCDTSVIQISWSLVMTQKSYEYIPIIVIGSTIHIEINTRIYVLLYQLYPLRPLNCVDTCWSTAQTLQTWRQQQHLSGLQPTRYNLSCKSYILVQQQY